MEEICSSIGSRISFATPSGDAPGYGIPIVTTGGATSGNSSVLSLRSANSPNTTSVTMATMVMSGFLIAKSEMNMRGDPAEVYFWFCFRAGSYSSVRDLVFYRLDQRQRRGVTRIVWTTARMKRIGSSYIRTPCTGTEPYSRRLPELIGTASGSSLARDVFLNEERIRQFRSSDPAISAPLASCHSSNPSLPHVTWRRDLDRRPRRDAAGGAEEDGVAGREAAGDLHRFCRLVADAECDFDLLHLAVPEADDGRAQATLIHRRDRHHRRRV